jgi:hypothetical protein
MEVAEQMPNEATNKLVRAHRTMAIIRAACGLAILGQPCRCGVNLDPEGRPASEFARPNTPNFFAAMQCEETTTKRDGGGHKERPSCHRRPLFMGGMDCLTASTRGLITNHEGGQSVIMRLRNVKCAAMPLLLVAFLAASVFDNKYDAFEIDYLQLQ